jgi:molybdate transport system substrate-binding protein
MLWAAVVAAAIAAAGSGSAQQSEVLVSAAASLSDVMTRVARAYEARAGVRVTVNTGASNTLARQITAGARVDLFISADEAQMDLVRSDIVSGTRIDLLSNQLAIAVAADRPRTMRSARDLIDPAIKRIAMGDPAAVPAGVYAKAYLETLGIWKQLSAKVVPSASVRVALAAVENGAADAAIVYRTDLAAARRAALALSIPVSEGPRIVYPAAVLRGGRHRDAAVRFLAWLRDAEASAIFRAAGFIPLSEGRPAASARGAVARDGRPLPVRK